MRYQRKTKEKVKGATDVILSVAIGRPKQILFPFLKPLTSFLEISISKLMRRRRFLYAIVLCNIVITSIYLYLNGSGTPLFSSCLIIYKKRIQSNLNNRNKLFPHKFSSMIRKFLF
ncbi:hypothetical protein DdX_18913 [Ditylenchus destructor]|uniref:Uncharacterized protein n=1 Tax=Ditylenchus destructor TaxID=166010 RepID=A0AAD4MJU0_9BILA|nr:hypothetical protein DdX_18913 [Ditylenchus destructor]